MTYCRDCQHIRPSQAAPKVAAYAHCEVATVESPVDGSKLMFTCHEARGLHGPCGHEARLFTEKKAAEAA